MKVYLVGGAVRDRLLELKPKEKDWVVVGATPDKLLSKGFRKVGKDFPVFLHPETNEEYALARTERKTGNGYYGFDCQFDPSVTLEEDLLRRDLTINAMAMDEKGHLIDPYQGEKDLKNKILRHVSPAFVEDPVRVLRVARFLARYHHLGFRIAQETRLLMYQMVKRNDLQHIVAERIWQEWQRSLGETNPEQFILALRDCGALSVLLPEIDNLFGIPNPKKYHREIDTGIHVLFSLQAAVKLSENLPVRFAALLHDVGKALTPMMLWPKHHQHEQGGMSLLEPLCQRLRVPSEYKDLALIVSCYHLTVHRVFELKPNTIVSVLEKLDAFRRPQRFFDILLACEADAKACGDFERDYPQREIWHALYKCCADVQAQALIKPGMRGIDVKRIMHQSRIQCVKDFWKTYEK